MPGHCCHAAPKRGRHAARSALKISLTYAYTQFNRSMRLYARKLGYSLNQRGLSKGVMRGKNGLKFTEGACDCDEIAKDTVGHRSIDGGMAGILRHPSV
jgi:hypothetical protein